VKGADLEVVVAARVEEAVRKAAAGKAVAVVVRRAEVGVAAVAVPVGRAVVAADRAAVAAVGRKVAVVVAAVGPADRVAARAVAARAVAAVAVAVPVDRAAAADRVEVAAVVDSGAEVVGGRVAVAVAGVVVEAEDRAAVAIVNLSHPNSSNRAPFSFQRAGRCSFLPRCR
jgi:hypothetical protein